VSTDPPSTPQTPGPDPRDAANWAKAVQRLHVAAVPVGAFDTVEGRRTLGPVQGFGRMWQKTYRVRLDRAGVAPAEVVRVWKERFASFWPRGARFFTPASGMAPGGVALLDSLLPGGLRMSSGVLVLYADEESFTVMAAEGMPFAGWNTFSAFDDGGTTVAQVQLIMRASDPLFELALAVGGHRMEDRHWQRTLANLAAHFGVRGTVEWSSVLLDPNRQWSKAGNLWRNAAVRSALHTLSTPLRRFRPRPRP
jgi:hypothetical protein